MRIAEHFFDAVGRGLRGRRAARGRFASLGHTLAPLALDNDTRRRVARAGRSLRRQGDQYLRAASGWDSDDLLRASQTVRRRGETMLQPVPREVLWIGAAVLAGVAVAWLSRRGSAQHGRRVGDVMVRDVFTIDASATLAEAAQMMRDGNVGVLPVVDHGRLRGVITDRDLVVRAMARNMDASSTPVRYVASEDLACARPDWDVEHAMRVMADCQIGRLPVVDGDDRVVGIVTLSSLALRSREQRDALHTAQEVSRRSARLAS